MKIVLAYIVMNYEIESLEKRPDNIVFADLNLPHLAPVIRLKSIAKPPS